MVIMCRLMRMFEMSYSRRTLAEGAIKVQRKGKQRASVSLPGCSLPKRGRRAFPLRGIPGLLLLRFASGQPTPKMRRSAASSRATGVLGRSMKSMIKRCASTPKARSFFGEGGAHRLAAPPLRLLVASWRQRGRRDKGLTERDLKSGENGVMIFRSV